MLNMKKQYRAELRDLKRNRNKVERDLRKVYLDVQKAREKVTRDGARLCERASKSARKEIAAIDRRILTLEGRL